jgi:ATP-binding cassette subfamily F protein uup
LLLARLFARPANILVLDEPTNDLDIDTLELLENLLQDFNGTLFLVSHDRAFLENTVTQVITFEGNGVLTEFGGGYDDWQRFTAKREADKAALAKAQSSKPVAKEIAPKSTANKLSFKEQKELDEMPALIEKLEAEQTSINLTLADANIYVQDPDKVKTLQTRLTEIEAEIEAKMLRWEALDKRIA